jgi:hypothetical protein
MNQKNAKSRGKNFIRVLLNSGTSFNPMGDEELAIFCQCNNEEPSIEDVDIKGLLHWLNHNPDCKKNQSCENYKISQHNDAMSVIFLNERDIQCCHNANRIFPCLNQI